MPKSPATVSESAGVHLPKAIAGSIKEQSEMSSTAKKLFSLGRVVATPGALDALREANVHPIVLLICHQTGDWGTLDETDWKLNDEAVHNELRILSAYILPTGTKIWIITEWDRSVTTFLLPSEY